VTKREFKPYEEMTPEERDARNEAAFSWGSGLIFFPPPPGWTAPPDEDEPSSWDEPYKPNEEDR
jgi:hypothetical protein